jgi:hypothetical protein
VNETKKLPALWMSVCVVAGLLIGAPIAGAKLSEADKDAKSQMDTSLQGSSTKLEQLAQSEGDRRMPNYVLDSFAQLLQHAKDLKLSEAQVNKVKDYAAEYQQVVIRAEAVLKRAERDIVAWQHDDKADMIAAEIAAKQSEAALTAVRLQGKKALRLTAAVLTPDQRENWRRLRKPLYWYHVALGLRNG